MASGGWRSTRWSSSTATRWPPSCVRRPATTRSSRRWARTASLSPARRSCAARWSAPFPPAARRWSTCSPTPAPPTRARPPWPEARSLQAGQAHGAAEEQVVLGDAHLLELEGAHDLAEDDETGDERGGAVGVHHRCVY